LEGFLQKLEKNESKCRITDKAIRSAKKHNVFKPIPEKQSVVSRINRFFLPALQQEHI